MQRRAGMAMPMQMVGQPEEVARAVLWLCSDQARSPPVQASGGPVPHDEDGLDGEVLAEGNDRDDHHDLTADPVGGARLRVFIGRRFPMADVGVILKRFESPDETRIFQLGKLELVHIGAKTIGRATYQPGWRWSQHVGSSLGLTRCTVEHVGVVLSGIATAAFDDGTVVELRAGQLFYIPATPHDSWVIGDEPYVSLHVLGAEHYAATHR
jgi:mannose-6-phosphate isomerase-like protein (cupin superfamily)